MDRGYLGALTYDIPLNPQAAPQQQAVQQPVNAMGQVPPLEQDPLAVREGLTSQYYDAYSMLKNYVADAQAKGINPYKPDYSQPGGGIAYQTFQKLQGLLLNTANTLGAEFKKEQQLDPLRYQNKAGYAAGFDPRKDLLVEDPNAVVSYEPSYQVEAANRATAQHTYSTSDQNRLNKEAIDKTIAEIDNRVAMGLLSPQQAIIDKSNLVANVSQTPRTSGAGGGSGTDKKPITLDLAKAIVNQATGAWVPGTYEETFVNGKRMLRSTKFADVVGKKQVEAISNGMPSMKDVTLQIKDWLKDPQTGEITVRYTDPSEPDKKLSPQEAEQLMVSIISSNPKYGGTTEIPKLYEAAKQLGWLDETNTLRPEVVVERPDLIQQGVGRTTADEVLDRETNKVIDKLGNTDSTIASFAIDGRTIKIDQDENGYYLYNHTSIDPKTGKPFAKLKSKAPRFATEEEVINFLTDQGYFDLIKKASYSGKKVAAPTKVAPATNTSIDW